MQNFYLTGATAPLACAITLRHRRLERLGLPAATARAVAALAFREPANAWRFASAELVLVEANNG